MCLQRDFYSFLIITYMFLVFFTMGFMNMAGVTIFPPLINAEIKNQYPNLTLQTYSKMINLRMSYLMGSRSIIHLILTPLWGILINNRGPMGCALFGLITQISGCVLLAFKDSFVILLISRIIEGVGSSALTVAALAIIAVQFTDYTEKSCLMGLSSISIILGNYSSPFISGLLYEQWHSIGKIIVFLFIVVLKIISIICHFLMQRRKPNAIAVNTNQNTHEPDSSFNLIQLRGIGSRDSLDLMIESSFVNHIVQSTPIHVLIMDPYIDICILGIIITHLPHFCLMSTLSVWLRDSFHVSETIQGLVWLPSFAYNILTFISGLTLVKYAPKHCYAYIIVSFIITGFSCIALPFSSSWWVVMIVLGNFAAALTLTKLILLPLVSLVGDSRHSSSHGSVAAIINESMQTASAIAFFGAGPIVNIFGFLALNITMAIISFSYCPFGIFLKRFFNDAK